jgi:hypothetical protein
MNKRGSAFGAYNGVYGAAWFQGSVNMGLLYDYSLPGRPSSGCANRWPRRHAECGGGMLTEGVHT